MDGPILLASGRDADVFAVDDLRVLRRSRTGCEAGSEVAVMTHVAAAGFAVPAVYEVCGPDLIMERLYGPTMLSALIDEEIKIPDAAAILAELHLGLHQISARVSDDPRVRILHLDLHPDNVVLSSRGPVVIDWRNSAEGAADLDVALSAVIIAGAAIDQRHPMATGARTLLAEFLRRVGGDPQSMLAEAIELRRADPNVTDLETGALDAVATMVAECHSM